MNWLNMILGRGPRKRTLHIEGPALGPVGEYELRRVAEEVRALVNKRYGHLFLSTRPMASLDVGKISLTLETEPISQEQAQEITAFARQCFDSCK